MARRKKDVKKNGRGRCLWLRSGMPKFSYKAIMWLYTNVFQFLFPKIYFSSEQSLEDFYWKGCVKGPEVKESYLQPFFHPSQNNLCGMARMWNRISCPSIKTLIEMLLVLITEKHLLAKYNLGENSLFLLSGWNWEVATGKGIKA